MKKNKHIDQSSHDKDHVESRRNFLKKSATGLSFGVLMSQFPVYSLNRLFSEDDIAGNEDRILIQLTLNGGCDGLNTIVPYYNFSEYKLLRPTIGWNHSDLISLNDEFSIPTPMAPLKDLWDQGKMKVIHGTGYENQNLSHFRSADIWHTATDEDIVSDYGWMAKYLMETIPDITTNPPDHPMAIQIGGQGTLLFNNFEGNNLALEASRIETLFKYAEKGIVYSTENLPNCEYGDNVEYLRLIANSTFKYASIIKEAYDNGRNNVSYEDQLGQAFGLIARVISGGLRTKIFHVNLSGFDTHANQKRTLPSLLESFSRAIKTFFEDTQIEGTDKKIIVMTQSEFGRRPYENGSGGTDHGAAAPLFLFGPGLNGNGFISDHPSLTDFDRNGNLKYNVDFRRIYSSILQNWFCIPESSTYGILDGQFDTLDLGLDCEHSTDIPTSGLSGITYKLVQTPDGTASLILNFAQARNCYYSIYDLKGRRIKYEDLGILSRGEHRIQFNKNTEPNGFYLLSFHVDHLKFSEKILLIN